MKSKFTVKILGTLVALAMLASLIVGVTASPASAAAGTLAWGTYATPSNANYLLGGYNNNVVAPAVAAPMSNPTINMVAASPTGSEIFGLDAANETLYSSTNGGASWSEVAVTGIVAPIAFVVSPNFKTDNAMAIATQSGVWISTNAGAGFTNISPNLGTPAETITSLALGYWFNTGNVLTALVGFSGAAATNIYGSNVIDYTYGAFGWAALKNAIGATTGPQMNNVYGVAFSPAAITDGEIMAVYENTGVLYISSDFGALGWNSSAYPDNAIIGATGTPVTVALTAINYVKIATASDYVGNTGASIFVGTNGATTATANVDDVYRVSGRANGPGSAVAEGLDKSVTSLAVSGPIATATVLAGYGSATAGGLSFTTTATASPPSWSGSSGLGSFTISDGVSVAVAGSMVVAGTQGTDGGIYVSSNLGSSFQGVGALNCGAAAVLPVKLVSFTPASATTWFVTMANTDGEEYVFVTTNGGTSWMRIYAESPVAPATSVNLMVSASTAYATDSTVVISDGSSLLHESTNGGISFSSVGSAATTVSSIFVINASNIFVGTTGGTYKVGSFAQGATDGTAVTSFALSPEDKTLATFLVGQSDGTVWQTTNNGGSFTEIGAAPGSVNALNPVTYVAYGTDGTIYAAEGTGVFSWSTTAAAWSNLGPTLVSAKGLAVASNNVLYVMDSTAANLVLRSVNPNQENTAAGGAPTFNTMNFGTVSGTNNADILTSMAVLSATAGDTVLVMDTGFTPVLPAVQTLVTGGVEGCIEGFVDTMAVAPTKLVPANNAVVSLPGNTMNVTLSWAAVPGATSYQVVVNGSVVTVAGQSFTTDTNSYTLTVNYGSAYTWSVYPYSVVAIPAGNQPAPFLGLSSPTQNFTTALAPILVTPIPFNPAQGASNVPLSNFTFTWPADQTDINAGLTVTYQFAIAQASANTSANEFAILDYSDNTATNAETLQETLQPNSVYWWEVRSVAMNGTGGVATYGAWAVSTFTTGPAMTSTTVAPPVTVTQTNVTITQTQTTVQSTVTSLVVTQAASTQAIPAYLLWIVIVIGAILVIAVIVLIVRTRRIP
jgi:hypothetical protein